MNTYRDLLVISHVTVTIMKKIGTSKLTGIY